MSISAKEYRKRKPEAIRFRHLRRKVVKVSQVSLAAYLDVTPHTIWAWEKCHSRIPKSAILAVLGLAERVRNGGKQ
jgi:DNA-binding transcriptional regulator YiaG